MMGQLKLLFNVLVSICSSFNSSKGKVALARFWQPLGTCRVIARFQFIQKAINIVSNLKIA